MAPVPLTSSGFLKLFNRTFSSGKYVFLSSSNCNLNTIFTRSPPFVLASRSIHSSSVLNQPRFKLKVEREAKPSVEEENNDNVTDDAEDFKTFSKSHPYRNLNPWKSKSELASHLVENAIYTENGLFVTNKPFGVGVRKPTGKTMNYSNMMLHQRGLDLSPYCLEQLVPELRYLLKQPELVFVKSTEKLSSGIAVFANDEKTGERFSKAIRSSKGYYDTLYTYHVVSTLTPLTVNPEKVERVGVIIKTGADNERGQPVVVPTYSINSIKRGEVTSIHVRTTPIRSGQNGGCLVELATGGTKHNFLRIHCANKLAPILGDNLYSSRVRMIQGMPARIDPTHLVPGAGHQILSVNLQKLLGLTREEDSILIPSHVHLRSYKVYRYLGGGSELKFEAPYPPHFKWTCSKLGMILDADSVPNEKD